VLVDGAEVLPAFTTSAPPSAILWHVNARFNARCIWVTGDLISNLPIIVAFRFISDKVNIK